MLEKRNIIRRNLTGGLALGVLSGILLPMPDLVTALFRNPGGAVLAVIALNYFTWSVLAGGFLGLCKGLFDAAVKRFSDGAAMARHWNLWGRRMLAAMWATSIGPHLPFHRNTRWFISMGFGLVAALLLPWLVERIARIASSRKHRGILWAFLPIFWIGGFACTSLYGAGKLFFAPQFWFMTAFFLHAGSFFFLARWIRSGYRRSNWLSPLASPGTVTVMLVLALVGGSWARRLATGRETEIARTSPIVHTLHAGNPPEPDAQSPQSGDPEKPENRPPRHTLQLDTDRSVLVVTSTSGNLPSFLHGFTVHGGVSVSADPEMFLGSLFTGRHLPLWARMAPHLPAPGPAWHEVIASRKKLDVQMFGPKDMGKSPYFRELPRFGFPEPFHVEGFHPLESFLQTTDLLARPFFVWVHSDTDAGEDVIRKLGDVARNGDVIVVWMEMNPAGTSSVTILNPACTDPAVEFEAPFSIAGILPSLLPLAGHRTEFPQLPFPSTGHPLVTVNPEEPTSGHPSDIRRLENRIRTRMRARMRERWPNQPDQLAGFLETRICRGDANPSELRQIEARVRPFLDLPQIRERKDLLLWRAGSFRHPPAWVHERFWNRLLHTFSGAEPSREERVPEIPDPFVLAWVRALASGTPGDFLEHSCPGVKFSLPGLGNR